MDHEVTVAFHEFHQASLAAARAIPKEKPGQTRLRAWAPTHGTALRDTRETFVVGAEKLVGARVTEGS
jgi:hypothetical protein